MSGVTPARPWRTLRPKAVVLGLGLLAAIGFVGLVTTVEATSHPTFCGSCHVMTPYYDSWKVSSHKNIACVECHIAPGVTAEIEKKWEAMSMVARYFTGTYSSKPWAEVEDAACLKCHERRLLSGRVLFKDVLFDHTAHLSGMRGGKTLRCTSCHSQIVQGSHITVTSSTCILCHFKDQTSGAGTARCTLCHPIPSKVIQTGSSTFNHSDVGRMGMECTWCHARPAGQNGEVHLERCVTCHNDPRRLEKFGDTELLHHKHVSEHKVECTACHAEIRHVGPTRVEHAPDNCATCHRQGHSPQMSLYTGVGGRGVDPMPSVMYLSGVRCEGCHFEIPGEQTAVNRATEVSCMSCHGPKYRGILVAWKHWSESRTTALEQQLAETTAAMAGSEPPVLADARANLDFVRTGRAVHNVPFADSLLTRAHADLNAARKERGLDALPVPWPVLAPSPCLRCHQGIEGVAGKAFGKDFRHEVHVVKARLDCAECHRSHEERADGEVLRFGAEGCITCHHSKPDADCASCHQAVMEKMVKSSRGEFSHKVHVDDAGLDDCATCHVLEPGKPPVVNEKGCVGVCHKK